MYIKKYWGNFIGGSDDSLNLVALLVDQKKEEIPLSEVFAKIGLDKQNWDFRQTVEYLEFTHSDGVEMDFHFAIDVVTDLAAILLECSVSGSVNLQDLDEYNTPSRRIRITATPEEHDAMNKALADFAQNPLEYDLSEMMNDEEIQEMARDVEALRKELYEAAGRNRDFHVKAEDMKNLLPDWEEASGCIATNRITVEGCKVGYCYREKTDGDWDSGWRFTAGDESDEYMDDPNNAGIYGLNTICNDDPDIIPLLNTPAPCAFERDENGVFQQIKDWKPDEDEENPDMDILQQCQKWHEENKHQKIIEALEGIEERTPEMDSQLARAYNNEADHRTPEGRAIARRTSRNTPGMTPTPWPSLPSPCSGGPCGLPRNSRCPSCLTIKEDSSGGGDRGAKTPGRYISGASGLPVERPGPGGKGLEAAEKGRLQKENEKRADLSDLV